jgi:hypothetical protein
VVIHRIHLCCIITCDKLYTISKDEKQFNIIVFVDNEIMQSKTSLAKQIWNCDLSYKIKKNGWLLCKHEGNEKYMQNFGQDK